MLRAWKRGDRAAALKIAEPAAVEAFFSWSPPTTYTDPECKVEGRAIETRCEFNFTHPGHFGADCKAQAQDVPSGTGSLNTAESNRHGYRWHIFSAKLMRLPVSGQCQ
jgi:hypothetical protein